MLNTSKKYVAILGMHRSGTSMVSGVLTKLGLFSGANSSLMKPDKYNPKGYFENNYIVDCNEQILADAVNNEFPNIHNADCFLDNKKLDGFGWLFGAWLKRKTNITCTPIESILIKKALNKFNEGSSKDKICLIKDPRMSLTFQKWSNTTKIDAAVVMLRNPVNVGCSLFRRNKIFEEISYKIWQFYTFNALLSVEKIPHIVIDYESLLYDREKTLKKILSFLDVVNYKSNDILIRNALEFIETKMNHGIIINRFDNPDKILELYYHIKDNKIINIKALNDDLFEQAKENWKSALYIASENKRKMIVSKYRGRIDRLNNHILTGNIIKILRKIKKDPTFGSQF